MIGRDVTREAVIQGVVLRDGAPVPSAYVRLLDDLGEFTAEIQTDDEGAFRFFAGDGDWTLRVLAPRSAAVDAQVSAQVGSVSEIAIET